MLLFVIDFNCLFFLLKCASDSKKSTHSDWAPVLDGDFFPSTPAAMRAATQPKPSIFGNYFASCFFGVDGAATQHKPSFFGTPSSYYDYFFSSHASLESNDVIV